MSFECLKSINIHRILNISTIYSFDMKYCGISDFTTSIECNNFFCVFTLRFPFLLPIAELFELYNSSIYDSNEKILNFFLWSFSVETFQTATFLSEFAIKSLESTFFLLLIVASHIPTLTFNMFYFTFFVLFFSLHSVRGAQNFFFSLY